MVEIGVELRASSSVHALTHYPILPLQERQLLDLSGPWRWRFAEGLQEMDNNEVSYPLGNGDDHKHCWLPTPKPISPSFACEHPFLHNAGEC